MSSLFAFPLGDPEVFVISFVCILLVPLPLFIACKVGFNQGKRKGKLEAEAELYRMQQASA